MWVLMIFLLTPVYKVLSVKDSVITRVVSQRITANCDSISYAEVLLKARGRIELRIINEEGEILGISTVFVPFTRQKTWVRFEFAPPVPVEKRKKFILELSSRRSFGVYLSYDVYSYGFLTEPFRPQEDLVAKVYGIRRVGKEYFGVELYLNAIYNMKDRWSILKNLVQRAGIPFERSGWHWLGVQTFGPNDWNWTEKRWIPEYGKNGWQIPLDSLMWLAEYFGVEEIPILIHTPKWASTSPGFRDGQYWQRRSDYDPSYAPCGDRPGAFSYFPLRIFLSLFL